MFALEPSKAQAVTARRFFEAMIQMAHDLDLGDGRRFPPAEICACARLLEDSGSLQPRRLAQELSSLIFEVWWDARYART